MTLRILYKIFGGLHMLMGVMMGLTLAGTIPEACVSKNNLYLWIRSSSLPKLTFVRLFISLLSFKKRQPPLDSG